MFLRRVFFFLGTLILVVTGNPIWEPEVKNQNPNEIGGSSTKGFPVADHISSREAQVHGHATPDYRYPAEQQQQLQPSVSVHSAGAGDFSHGTGSSGHYGTPSAFHYQIYPHHEGGSHSNYYSAESYAAPLDESGGSWLCRTFSGMCDGNNRQGFEAQFAISGILGLIGLGLKKLKLIKLAPFLPIIIPLLPILLPIALIILVPVLVAAWFLPVVPVIVTGRALSVSAIRNVQEMLLSENCLERISCEAFRVSRGFGFDAPWIHRFLDTTSANAKWIEKVARGGRSTSGCGTFACRPVAALQKSMKIN